MELTYAILIVTALVFGFAMMIPVSIHLTLNLDAKLSVTIGFRFLLFKYESVKKRRVNVSKIKQADNRFEKKWTIIFKEFSVKSFGPLITIIARERRTFRRTLAAFANFTKAILLSADRRYFKINLSGGLSSPDLTGQLYGFIQACKSLSYDSISLSYVPDFMNDKLRGTIVAGTVFRIYEILNQLMLFIWRLPKMKLIKIYYHYRKESENV